jgi:hypothetical protein
LRKNKNELIPKLPVWRYNQKKKNSFREVASSFLLAMTPILI